jgi:GntR family transcriptional regulator, transcriptional repressor for pyruvate dehydrogenase complex
MDGQVRSMGKGTLVERVGELLRESILSGSLVPGEKLPSESQLIEAYGVSRTVIREAVAALRSDGLVEARQGAGVFVIEWQNQPNSPRISIDRSKLSSVLELLEIRTPLEIEAAGLAAIRRSPAQEEEILFCYATLVRRTELNQPIRDADFALHLAIADATNNPRFREFLETHGQSVIPKSEIVTDSQSDAERAYHAQLNREHQNIVLAISRGDEDAAREAMRQHLKGSQARHRDLLQNIRIGRTT